MRYYAFAGERSVNGAIVARWKINVRTTADALRAAREATAKLSKRQADSSIVRLIGNPFTGGLAAAPEIPIAAFRKHPKSGRVTRV